VTRWSRPTTRALRPATALAVLALVVPLAACGTEPLPEPAPRSESEVVPVASDAQVELALTQVTEAVQAADEASDWKLLGPLVAGPAAAQRSGAYAVRGRDATQDFVVPLGSTRLQDAVPAEQEWPRTVLSVTQADADDRAPDLLVLSQAGPRDPYQLVAYTEMAGGATLPLTGGADVGAPVLPADAPGLVMTPEQAMAAYGDVLTRGTVSSAAPAFAQSTFTDTVLAVQAQTAKSLTVDCDDCFDYAAAHAPRAGEVWSFGTEDGGALVVGALDSTMTIKANGGYKMNLQPEFQAMSGAAQITATGTFTHLEVVALHVPPEGAEDPTVKVVAVDRVPVKGTVS
jgi:hypothetical protein